jgi:hypothetical protein
MTQSITTRSNFRMLPGHIYTPDVPGREPESLYAPYTPQQLTFTLAGADPITAGIYTYSFVTPTGSFTVSVTQLAVTPTAASVIVAAALNADPQASALFTWTSALGVVTGVARSANTSIAVPGTTTNAPTTNTAAQSVANAANSLRMGLWYRHSTVVQPYAISGTPRGANRAALPTGATTIAQLRGVIARAVNQTTLSPLFQDGLTYDSYLAGQVFPGLLRGQICTVVDPASAAMSPGSQVHVVIAAGAYSVIGSVAAAADGGNTLRLDDTTPVRARVTAIEETLSLGLPQRLVALNINQTN